MCAALCVSIPSFAKPVLSPKPCSLFVFGCFLNHPRIESGKWAVWVSPRRGKAQSEGSKLQDSFLTVLSAPIPQSRGTGCCLAFLHAASLSHQPGTLQF